MHLLFTALLQGPLEVCNYSLRKPMSLVRVVCPHRFLQFASAVHVAELPRSTIRVQHVSHGTGSRRRGVQRLAITPSGPIVDLRSTTTLVSVVFPVPEDWCLYLRVRTGDSVRLVAAQKERFYALE